MNALIVVVFVLLERTAIAGILDEKRLEHAIATLPDVKFNSEAAARLVAEAIDAAGTDLDPFVLLAQTYIESRFDSTATSRLINGKRHVGPWASRQAPSGWTGNLYCGIAQNASSTWAGCLALRETRAALAAQASELRVWLHTTHGDLPRALAGYGCGNAGAVRGSCNGYPQRILLIADRLRRATVGIPMG